MGRTKGSGNKPKVDKSIGGYQPLTDVNTSPPNTDPSFKTNNVPLMENPPPPPPRSDNLGDLTTGFSEAFATNPGIKDPSPSEDLIKGIEERNLILIEAKYNELCRTPGDINELLPYLRAVADQCDHITEFGVRTPTSTYAFLMGNPERLVSYDIVRSPEVDQVEELAGDMFLFVEQDVLEADIEETDFLFIDTYHTATQLEMELQQHAHKVRKFLGFHDIYTFGHVGEPWYPGIPDKRACGRGLWESLNPFLNSHPEWKIDFKTNQNNGLLILRRHE